MINVTGSALLAALRRPAWRHPLDVLFAGSGVLGGFTTMSTYAVHVDRLIADGHAALALGYAAATLLVAVGASHVVWRGVLRGGQR